MDGIRRIRHTVYGQECGEIDYSNENTDVLVEMTNGDMYVASFFTYKNIESLRNEHLANDHFLGGTYFWRDNMILIEDITSQTVERVISHLQDEGNFYQVFRKL